MKGPDPIDFDPIDLKTHFIIPIIILTIIVILDPKVYANKKPEIINKPTLYALNKPLNEGFVASHPYLENLQQVSYYGGISVIAKCNKALDKTSFIELIDSLIENGYIRQGGWNQEMKIKKRKVYETSESIAIIDEGINTIFIDTPPFGEIFKEIIIEYRYDKNNGNIHFKPS